MSWIALRTDGESEDELLVSGFAGRDEAFVYS
jgi:hypothetical protein